MKRPTKRDVKMEDDLVSEALQAACAPEVRVKVKRP